MNIFKKLIIKTSYLLLLVLTFCYFTITINASSDSVRSTTSKTECKVAYFTESNFSSFNADSTGNITKRYGYAYDYIQAIASYADIEYTYVSCTRSEALNKLINGEVDLMYGLSKTGARRESGILYSNLQMGTESYYLYTCDSSDTNYSDNSSLNGKTILVETNSILKKQLQDFIDNNSLSVNVIDFDATSNMDFKQLLIDNNADLIAYTDIYLTSKSELYPVVQFGSSEIYLGLTSSRKDLLDLINDAQAAILLDNPSFITDLANTYFKETPAKRLLTLMEKNWISENPIIDVGFVDYYPYVSGEESNPEGTYISILNKIFKKFNIDAEIRYKKYNSYTQMINDLNSTDLDIALPCYGSLSLAEENDVLVTQSLITSSIKMVYCNEFKENILDQNDLSNVTIAIVSDSPLHKNFVNEYFPNCKTILCSDYNECLDQLKYKKADITFVSTYRQNVWLTNKEEYKVKDLDYLVSYKYAVAKDHASLLSILNRGISIIGNDNIQNELVSYIEATQTTPFDLVTYLQENIIWVIAVAIVLAVIITFGIYYSITRTKIRHKFEQLANTDVITNLPNRRAFNTDCQELKEKELPTDLVIYVSDIDNLKKTNDHIGHDAGDELIIAYTKVVNKYFSQIGKLYKTGGDEFVAILYTDEQVLDKLLELIDLECKSFKGNLVDEISFSYGIAKKSDVEYPTFEKLLHFAEDEMYKSKKSKKVEITPLNNNTLNNVNVDFSLDRITRLYTMEQFYTTFSDKENNIYKLKYKPCIISFNINSFKRYNQRYGFLDGNELLLNFANVLARVFGKDRSARFSEDKFFCIAPNFNIDEKINTVFKEFAAINPSRFLTLRAGCYVIENINSNIENSCDKARLACDSDKSEYESHYVIFESKLEHNHEIREFVIENIDEAIKNKEIVAYYQPKVDPYTNKLVGFEALARWISKEKGFISPGEFIPVLEEFNITHKVDLEILNQTASNMSKLIESGLKPVPVSFNISRTDFNVLDITSEINKIIDKYHLSHKMFQIEITESTVMSNPEKIIKEVNRFKSFGFDVLMDDFGSAYSSLGTLRELDFDEIKIDASFMRNFSSKSRIILNTTIGLCKSLNMRTCVEGVETGEQVQFLKRMKVDEIQGYYYGKPESYEKVVNMWFNKEED